MNSLVGLACRDIKGAGDSLKGVQPEDLFSTFFPTLPEKCFFLTVGDETEGVSYLFLVKLAEGSGLLHSSVHLRGLGRTRRAAKVAYSATVTGVDIFYLTSGDEFKGRATEDVFHLVGK